MSIRISLCCTILFGFLVSSCGPDIPEYPFRIKVYEIDDNDVRRTVRGAEVYVATDNPRSEVVFEGITNNLGEVTFMYEFDAVFRFQARSTTYDIDTIMNIDATVTPPDTTYIYDTTAVYYKNGCGIIKLKENEEAYAEVTIEEWFPENGGCF